MNTTTIDPTTVKLSSAKVQTDSLIPQGSYEFEVGDATVKMPKNVLNDKGNATTPYVEVELRLFGGALSEKGRPLFPKAKLFLGIDPGKDGVRNFERPSGLAAFFDSVGASRPDPEVVTVEATRDDGTLAVAHAFNAQEVKAAVDALRGMRGKLYLKVRTNTFNGATREENEVGRYIVTPTAS